MFSVVIILMLYLYGGEYNVLLDNYIYIID